MKKIINNNKKFLILTLIIVIILIFYFVFLLSKSYFYVDKIIREDVVVNIIAREPSLASKAPEHKSDVKTPSVYLNVLGQSYQGDIKDGDSVYQFMKNLQDKKENNFSFVGSDYPGLGFFVKEINGIKGISGHYWIYYVNDIEASVGVSNYILKDGDIISWKQGNF